LYLAQLWIALCLFAGARLFIADVAGGEGAPRGGLSRWLPVYGYWLPRADRSASGARFLGVGGT
jgi:hypothetical protein